MNASTRPGWGQSLANGAPGIALRHIERARAGHTGWDPVHHLAQAMTRTPIQANPAIASLFYGAPAVAYALHAAGQPAYRTALAALDNSINALIQTRLDAAHRRIDAGIVATAREFDLINGLTGLGVYLLHRHHDHWLLRDILSYLVRFTEPVNAEGQILPGWCAAGSPDRRQSPRWNGGHAGFGMAHGLAGPLALLSVTMRRRVIVSGQASAIRSACAWLARWQAGHDSRTWWPEAISRDELDSGTVSRSGPHRPSWCYGTPGVARACHLASLALSDPQQIRAAEQALAGCLNDPRQLAQLTGLGLCHGRPACSTPPAARALTPRPANSPPPSRPLPACCATFRANRRRSPMTGCWKEQPGSRWPAT